MHLIDDETMVALGLSKLCRWNRQTLFCTLHHLSGPAESQSANYLHRRAEQQPCKALQQPINVGAIGGNLIGGFVNVTTSLVFCQCDNFIVLCL